MYFTRYFRAKRGENFAVFTFKFLSKTIVKHGVVGTLLRDLAGRPGAYCSPAAGYTFA